MSERISLKDAIRAWRAQAAAEGRLGKHISPAELYELLLQSPKNGNTDHLFNHLLKCSVCVRELREMIQSMEEAEVWDLALPKAAASEIEWPKKIPAEGGKYTIVIRRSLTEKNRGVVTLQVAARYREMLEGKTVVLRDGRGQILLTAQILNGEVSQEIADLESIDPRFVVEPT